MFDETVRQTWDHNIMAVEAVRQCGANGSETRYEVYNWPFPLSTRDNVSRFRCMELSGSYLIYCESLPAFPITPKRCRMWSRSIVLIEPSTTHGGCTLKRETIVNPNGMIPQWVINKVAPRTARKWMENFQRVTARLDDSQFGQRLSLVGSYDRDLFLAAGGGPG